LRTQAAFLCEPLARAELQNNEPRLWNSFNRWEKCFFALPYKWSCTKNYRDRNLTIKVT